MFFLISLYHVLLIRHQKVLVSIDNHILEMKELYEISDKLSAEMEYLSGITINKELPIDNSMFYYSITAGVVTAIIILSLFVFFTQGGRGGSQASQYLRSLTDSSDSSESFASLESLAPSESFTSIGRVVPVECEQCSRVNDLFTDMNMGIMLHDPNSGMSWNIARPLFNGGWRSSRILEKDPALSTARFIPEEEIQSYLLQHENVMNIAKALTDTKYAQMVTPPEPCYLCKIMQDIFMNPHVGISYHQTTIETTFLVHKSVPDRLNTLCELEFVLKTSDFGCITPPFPMSTNICSFSEALTRICAILTTL